MIIPVVIWANGIVTKGLKKNLELVPGNLSICSIQKIAIVEVSHIIRKVLQSETSSLNGGDHHWFKRSTRKKRSVTKRHDDGDGDGDEGYVRLDTFVE
jgi:hypothetical protein